MNGDYLNTANDEVIFPPGVDYSIYEGDGYLVKGYGENGEGIGGAVSQEMGYKKEIKENNDTLKPIECTLPEYLEKYTGKYICIELWENKRGNSLRCGRLNAIGKDFIVIENRGLFIADLKSVKYIGLYNRGRK